MAQLRKTVRFGQRTKYLPRPWAPYLQLAGIALAGLLFQGRTSEAVRIGFLTDWRPDFYQHISNFSLSLALYVGIGFVWLLMGGRYRTLLLGGLALISANLIYELFLPIANTMDPVDAWFGIAGTLAGLLLLTVIARFGLKPNPAWGADARQEDTSLQR